MLVALPCIIVKGGTWAGVKYFVTPDVLPIKLKRRAKTEEQSTVIRADVRNPSHSVTA